VSVSGRQFASGMRVLAQWAVADPGAANPFGLATTAGIGFTIQ
jgi:hypothetical protein